MTREDAVFYIMELQKTYASLDKKVAEAVDMAVEALKDVHNCVHCEHYTEVETDTGIHGECKMDTAHRGDLISRQDAIDATCDKCPISFKEKCEWKDNGNCSMKVALEALPSAEPKTKTGKWIAKSERYRWMRKCSVCGWMQEIDTPKMQGWVYRYCPNCGARMLGEDGKS